MPRYLCGVSITVMEEEGNMQSQGSSLGIAASIYQGLLYPGQRGNNGEKDRHEEAMEAFSISFSISTGHCYWMVVELMAFFMGSSRKKNDNQIDGGA